MRAVVLRQKFCGALARNFRCTPAFVVSMLVGDRQRGGALPTRTAGLRALCVLILALALSTAPALASTAPSGGAGLGGTSKSSTSAKTRTVKKKATRKTKKKAKRPARKKVKPAPEPPQRLRPVADPFAGRGMWIWYISASSGGNLSSIIAQAKAHGITTLMIKSGDGSSMWSQFNPTLVSTLHAAGIRVCAWQYVYGNHPLLEAQVGATAVKDGADCLLIDAEVEYEGKYVAAQTYMTQLRSLIGANFPVALAGFPYVDYHPAFPYSVFLGPGGAQFNTPQMYWKDIGTSVDAVYSHTLSFNQVYGRTIIPLGQTYSNPSASDVMRFRLLSRAYGTPGVSWWDWQETGASQWQALAKPATWLTGFSSLTPGPVLKLKSTSDLVVWAQEHLITAGYPVTVDGNYGPALVTAVQAFQTAKGLTPDGVIGPMTWQALLAYAPTPVTWTSTGATVTTAAASRASGARRAGVVALVPRSAHLRAKRYEIPAHLGRG
jgi:hypothetical protein